MDTDKNKASEHEDEDEDDFPSVSLCLRGSLLIRVHLWLNSIAPALFGFRV